MAQTQAEFRENIRVAMVDNSRYPIIAGQPMPNDMKDEMEDSMARLANPIWQMVASWALGLEGDEFPDENVGSDPTDTTPGFLSDKVDDLTLKVNVTSHKMFVDESPLATDVKRGGIMIGAQPFLYLAGSQIMLNAETNPLLVGGDNMVPTSRAVKLYVDSVVTGSGGGGDMLKSTYDTGENGVVDDAERLDNQLPSYYLSWANFTGVPTTVAGYGITDTYTITQLDAFFEGEAFGKKQVDWNRITNQPDIVAISDPINNRVVTSDGTTTGLVSEASLLFDGTLLTVDADADISGILAVDTINELTPGTGVTIETILHQDGNLSNVGYIDFDLLATPGHAEGRLHWSADDGTLEIGMPGGNVNLQIGQEFLARVRNNTGGTLTNGQVIYNTGASGNLPTVALADALSTSAPTQYAIMTETVGDNSSGYVNMQGLVRGLNTSSWVEGTQVYLSTTPGELTSTPPSAPNHRAWMGVVLSQHATEGTIYFKPERPILLSDVSDVNGTTPDATNKHFVWNNASGYWDAGQVDSADLQGTIIYVDDIIERTTDHGVSIDDSHFLDGNLYLRYVADPNTYIDGGTDDVISMVAGGAWRLYVASSSIQTNVDFLPGTTYARDLGSNTRYWAEAYLDVIRLKNTGGSADNLIFGSVTNSINIQPVSGHVEQDTASLNNYYEVQDNTVANDFTRQYGDRFAVTTAGEILVSIRGDSTSFTNVQDNSASYSLSFYKNRTTGGTASVSDVFGRINGYFLNDNATPQTINGAIIQFRVLDATDGSEDSDMEFWTFNGGAQTLTARFGAGIYLGAIAADETELYVVAIDNTTGLLSKRLVSGLGSGSDGVLTAVDATDITAVDFTITGSTDVLDVDFGHDFTEHDDVTLTSLATDNIMKWNGTAWINVPIPTSGTGNAYSSITDGTTTANASGSDTFKLRTANNLLTIAVQDNDATHGDNALFTINEANISHDNIADVSIDDHHPRDHALDGSTHTAAALTAGEVLAADTATTFSWRQLLYSELASIPTSFTPDTHASSHEVGGGDLVDHDNLTNYVAGEHFLQTAITNISTALATGILTVTTGTGLLGSITDNSTNWNTAYNHSQLTTGNPHNIAYGDISDFDEGVAAFETSHADVLIDGDFLSEGLMRRGATAGVYTIVTDNSTNWNTAYSHSQLTSGNPHAVTYAELGGTQPAPLAHAASHASTGGDPVDHNTLTNTHNLTTDINHANITGTHNLTTDIDHNTILNNHNLTTDIDHDTIANTHNLTTSIDHATITNTHNLTTDINHSTITGGHNLTTDIDHDTITNSGGNQHIDWTNATNAFLTSGNITTSADIYLDTNSNVSHNTRYIYWGDSGDWDTYISSNTDDTLSITLGGVQQFYFQSKHFIYATSGALAANEGMSVQHTEDSTTGAQFNFVKKRSTSDTSLDNDYIGKLSTWFYNDNASPQLTEGSRIHFQVTDATDGTEDTRMLFYVRVGGAMSTYQMEIAQTFVNITGTLRFADANTTIYEDGSSNLTFHDDVAGILTLSQLYGGSSPMVYPGAGIAVSTGSAWGASITDNSTNWNTAYTHSQVVTGNPHAIGYADISDFNTGVSTYETSHAGLVSWGTPSNNWVAYGDSSSGNIASITDFSFTPTGAILTLNSTTGSTLQLEYNATNHGYLQMSSGNMSLSTDLPLLAIRATGTNPRVAIGSSWSGNAWFTIKDYDTVTPYTYTIQTINSAGADTFSVGNDGSLLIPELGDNDSEDHLMAINDTSGLVTKRSVASIVAEAGTGDVTSDTSAASGRIAVYTTNGDTIGGYDRLTVPAAGEITFGDNATYTTENELRITHDDTPWTFFDYTSTEYWRFGFASGGYWRFDVSTSGGWSFTTKSSPLMLQASGNIYMEALGDDDTEDHLVAIDDTTGLLTKRSVASLGIGGGDVSWGTPTNEYLLLGGPSGDIASTSKLSYNTTSDIFNITGETSISGPIGTNADVLTVHTNDSVYSGIRVAQGGANTGPHYIATVSDTTIYTSLHPHVPNGATAVAYFFDTVTTLTTAGAKIASFNNGGAEKAYLTYQGSFHVSSHLQVDSNFGGTDYASLAPTWWQSYSGGIQRISFYPDIADGASAIAHKLDTANNLTTAGAVLFTVRNASVEKFFIDKDGNVDIESGAEYRINGVAIGTGAGDVSWGTETGEQPVVYGGNGGDIDSTASDFTWLTTDKRLTIGGTGTGNAGGQIRMENGTTNYLDIFSDVNNNTRIQGKVQDTAVLIYPNPVRGQIGIGASSTLNTFLMIRDPSSTTNTTTLDLLDSTGTSMLTIMEAGTVYLPTLGDDDTEDHVIAIDDTTGLLTKRSVASISGSALSFGTAVDQIPMTNATLDDFDYDANFKYNGSTLSVASTVSITQSGGGNPFALVNSAGNGTNSFSTNTSGDGFFLQWQAGHSSSTTATHHGGALYLRGGNQSGVGGGNGGAVHLIGGTSNSESGGEIYLSPGVTDAGAGGDVNIGDTSQSVSEYRLNVVSASTDTGLYINTKGNQGIYLNSSNHAGDIRVGGFQVSGSASAWLMTRSNANIDTLTIDAGQSGTSAGWEAASLILKGGDGAAAVGFEDGGDVFIYPGQLSSGGADGQLFFGDGTSIGGLAGRTSETNVVYYDTTTGLLTYGGATAGGIGNPLFVGDDTSVRAAAFEATINVSATGTEEAASIEIVGNTVLNDYVGRLSWHNHSSTGTDELVALIGVTSGGNGGTLFINTVNTSNTQVTAYRVTNTAHQWNISGTEELSLTGAALHPDTNDGLTLGTSTLRFGAVYANGYFINGSTYYVDSIGTDMVFTDGSNTNVTLSSLVGGTGAQISGTPADGETAVWTSATTIEGRSELSFDSPSAGWVRINSAGIRVDTFSGGSTRMVTADLNGDLGTATIPPTITIANEANNRVMTAVTTDSLNAEANLTFDGTTLSTSASASSTFINIAGADFDSNIWRISNAAAAYGFYLRYIGTGTGIDNSLQLWTDNQNGTDLTAYTINQDGLFTANQGLIVQGGTGVISTDADLQDGHFSGSTTSTLSHGVAIRNTSYQTSDYQYMYYNGTTGTTYGGLFHRQGTSAADLRMDYNYLEWGVTTTSTAYAMAHRFTTTYHQIKSNAAAYLYLDAATTAQDTNIFFRQGTTAIAVVGWDDSDARLKLQYGAAFDTKSYLKIGASNLDYYGATSAYLTVDALTTTATLALQSNTGYDSELRFRINASTQTIVGWDAGLSAFQIHTSSAFTTLALADFSISAGGTIYMGNLGFNAYTNYLRYDSTNSTVGWYSSSDIRLKENIKSWEPNSLEFLTALDLIEYDRKDGSRFGEIGWNATQMKELMPDMVGINKKGYFYVYEALMPFHFHNSIKQLNEKQETQADKIIRLEKRVKELEDLNAKY